MSDRKCKAQAGFLKDLRKRAPAARGRPERGESLGADSRLSDHAFFRPVIAEAAQGKQRRPARHRTRVIVAALGFVPGVSSLAIVAAAAVLDHLNALCRHAHVEHESGGSILEPRPDLREIDVDVPDRIVVELPTHARALRIRQAADALALQQTVQ